MSYFLTCGRAVPAPAQTPLYFDLGVQTGGTATSGSYTWDVSSVYNDYANLTIDDFIFDIETPDPYYMKKTLSYNIGYQNRSVEISCNYQYASKSYNSTNGTLSIQMTNVSNFKYNNNLIGTVALSPNLHCYIIGEGEDNNFLIKKIASKEGIAYASGGSNPITVNDYYNIPQSATLDNFRRSILSGTYTVTGTNGTKTSNSPFIQIDIDRGAHSGNSYNSSTTVFNEGRILSLLNVNSTTVTTCYAYPSYDLWYVVEKV